MLKVIIGTWADGKENIVTIPPKAFTVLAKHYTSFKRGDDMVIDIRESFPVSEEGHNYHLDH